MEGSWRQFTEETQSEDTLSQARPWDFTDLQQFTSERSDPKSQQNEIGWNQLFLGRFTKEWADLQDNYYAQKRLEQTDEENKKIKKMTGYRWQVALIGILWDQWWAVWESRNKDLHGADAAARAQAEAREVHRTLRDLYDLRNRLDPHVQACLYEDVAYHNAQTTWFNQNWIAIHEPMIRANLKQITVRTTAGVQSIRRF